jgi:hypothetical protein
MRVFLKPGRWPGHDLTILDAAGSMVFILTRAAMQGCPAAPRTRSILKYPVNREYQETPELWDGAILLTDYGNSIYP